MWVLDGDRCFDTPVALVVVVVNGRVGKVGDGLNGGIETKRRERLGSPGKLGVHLLGVIGVDVDIAERVHEITDAETANVGNHVRQKRITGDVEREA